GGLPNGRHRVVGRAGREPGVAPRGRGLHRRSLLLRRGPDATSPPRRNRPGSTLMTFGRRGGLHPSISVEPGLRLYGKRVMLRPLMATDFPQWTEVRLRNEQWLTPWEPLRANNIADPTRHRDAFSSRCATRDRERQVGSAYGFGLFVDNVFAGEINVNNVVRGAFQCGVVGYWIDQRHAGNRYIAEGVAVICRFAFDE